MTEIALNKEFVGPEDANQGELNPLEAVQQEHAPEDVAEAIEDSSACVHEPGPEQVAEPESEQVAKPEPEVAAEPINESKANPANPDSTTNPPAKPAVTKKVVKRVVRSTAPAGNPKAPTRRPIGASSTTTTKTTKPDTSRTHPTSTTSTATRSGPGTQSHPSHPSASRAPRTTANRSSSISTPRADPPPATTARRTTIGSTKPSTGAAVKENKPPAPRMIRKNPTAPPAQANTAQLDKLNARIAQLEAVVDENTSLQDKYDAANTQVNEYQLVIVNLEKEMEAMKTFVDEHDRVAAAAATSVNDTQRMQSDLDCARAESEQSNKATGEAEQKVKQLEDELANTKANHLDTQEKALTEKSELISKLEVEMKNLSETHAGSQKERDDVAAQLNTANARISELEHHAHTLNDSMQVENAQLKSKIEELRTLVADKMQEDEEVLKMKEEMQSLRMSAESAENAQNTPNKDGAERVQELEGELSKSETLIADLKAVNERIMNQLAQQDSKGPDKYNFSTECVTIDNPDAGKDQFNSSSVPIYQSATFKGMNGEYDYSRSGNPTRTHLQHHLAKISSAKHAFAVSSGMAALDVIARILKPGDHVVAGDDLYGGSNRLLGYLQSNAGVVVHHIDTCTPSTVEQYLDKERTRLVLLETPTNPLIKICDVQEIASRVKAVCPSAIIVVDNTMMSPYLQRPLNFGADVVYDSATKYLSGHHDLMAGVVICNRDDLAKHMSFTINSVGNGLGPFDSFLLLRGLKTLAIRMDRQQASAKIIASFLNQLQFQVHYPGLKNHPGHHTHFKMAKDAGAVLSFETRDIKTSERIVGAAKLWGISVSFGAVNSLISMPCLMSHASIPAHLRAERGLPEDLIRLCVGIEDWEDLIDDLECSLVQAGAIRRREEQSTSSTLSSPEGSLERVGEERALGWQRCLPSDANNASMDGASQQPHASGDAENIVVSAPGKVILFGEHAVVHGVTAIASALDLRCYGCLAARSDDTIHLVLPDLHSEYSTKVSALPWAETEVEKSDASDGDGNDVDMNPTLIAAIEKTLPPSITGKIRGAVVAFVHHYMSLCYPTKPSLTFTARSSIPIGAGLGSSAAYSTCVSAALLLYMQKVVINRQRATPHISHSGRKYIGVDIAATVNKWAFASERILHGTPSGIDNSVSVFGGAISYARGRAQPMIPLHGFQSMLLLLANTHVERDAKAVISRVHALKANQPGLFDECMRRIQDVVDEAVRCFQDTDLPRESMLVGLGKLVAANHAQLELLGVSHPALEMIIAKLKAYGLQTKLTGAGGGGCTVTLLPDSFGAGGESGKSGESAHTLAHVTSNLAQNGFSSIVTTVGGSGLGVLIDKKLWDMRLVDQDARESVAPLAGIFTQSSAEELAGKMKECGHWVFV
ncbi:hypothetical protein E3P91_01209 [Wallemia ichthyophaga]|nr:hypothetical protein E3P91_01209 [Wallemia ichthyophaga]